LDAGTLYPQEALLVELQIIVAVAAELATAVIVLLVGGADRGAVVAQGSHLLDEATVELAIPRARQERLNGVAALQELGAIAPRLSRV
jgi:hypothetical protein